MKALIVIDIDENHLLKEANELYDRLKGYKCELKPIPLKKKATKTWVKNSEDVAEAMRIGWNACLDEITGEEE